MKKFCAFLLLLVLPLQISWAVAGSYCAHEQSLTAEHFGHHAHVHEAEPDDGDSKSPLQSHPDCSSCHHVTFSVLEGGAKVGTASLRSRVMMQLVSALPSLPPGEPERPKWYLVV